MLSSPMVLCVISIIPYQNSQNVLDWKLVNYVLGYIFFVNTTA
jgi:hypothetical protein